jgi:hypothetical protein
MLLLLQPPMAPMFNVWHSTLNDDSIMSDIVCPAVVSGESPAARFKQAGIRDSSAVQACGQADTV